MQTFWPAIRLCFQIFGGKRIEHHHQSHVVKQHTVTIGGSAGIAVIQITQFICVLGGPAGYLSVSSPYLVLVAILTKYSRLVTNTYASELVRPHERTSALGVLQGCVMFGTAIGFLLGGLTGDIFGIRSPFQIAFALMSLSSIYVLIFLPYIAPPPAIAASKSIQSQGLARFIGPARMFAAERFVLPNGKVAWQYGIPLLGLGVFFGVLATGYMGVLLQVHRYPVSIRSYMLMSCLDVRHKCICFWSHPKWVSDVLLLSYSWIFPHVCFPKDHRLGPPTVFFWLKVFIFKG